MGRIIYPLFKAFDGDGKPLSGGRVNTYNVGTTDDLEAYAGFNRLAYQKNPVILNADGEARIHLSADGPLAASAEAKLVTNDRDDTALWTDEIGRHPYRE